MLEKPLNTINAFFALLGAGLWERSVRLLPFEPIDFSAVYDLAEEQSVEGLIAAGLEHVEDRKVVKQEALPFMKKVFSLENRNKAMNLFIGGLVEKMRKAGIYALLIKGQGVAQCYSRPQWRSVGDVDFFLDKDNYYKAKAFLIPLADSVEKEDTPRLHLGMKIDPWLVELHGTMHTKISRRIDIVIDKVQNDVFEGGNVRVWRNEDVDVFIPSPDNDLIIVFTHFLKHFYVGGIGLRQICDWCRLLWVFRDEIDRNLLAKRLSEMGLMKEWRTFAAFAVDYIGMPDFAMPFYSDSRSSHRKSAKLSTIILETGSFGHYKESYRSRYPRFIEYAITFWRRMGEFIRLSTIFPNNAPKFFMTYVVRRAKDVL